MYTPVGVATGAAFRLRWAAVAAAAGSHATRCRPVRRTLHGSPLSRVKGCRRRVDESDPPRRVGAQARCRRAPGWRLAPESGSPSYGRARDFDLGGGFHHSDSYPMVFQHSVTQVTYKRCYPHLDHTFTRHRTTASGTHTTTLTYIARSPVSAMLVLWALYTIFGIRQRRMRDMI